MSADDKAECTHHNSLFASARPPRPAASFDAQAWRGCYALHHTCQSSSSSRIRGTGKGSSLMQAFSSMFVHFPLVPAWLCLRCCLKWSARKNFFAWLHSPNLCTSVKCCIRASKSLSVAILMPRSGSIGPLLGNSSPQYPHVSASFGRAGE